MTTHPPKLLSLTLAATVLTLPWGRIAAQDKASLSSPTDLRAAVASMSKIGSCSAPSFSPDGKSLAFLCSLTGLPQAWIVPAAGGWPTPVTMLDDPVGGLHWSPDGSTLAISVAPGGGMNQQIYLVRPDGSALVRLTDGGKENNWLGEWDHDGKQVLIASNRAGAGMDAYTCTPAGKFRLVATNAGIGYLTRLSRDGKRAVLYRMQSRGDNSLFLVDLQKGSETLLTKHDGPGQFTGGVFSPDGNAIYLTSDLNRDLAGFARIKLGPNDEPGAIELLAERKDADLERFEITQDGKTAALVWNVAGRNELAFMDLPSGKLSPGPSLPAEIVTDLTFAKDGNTLALALNGSASPADIWFFDRQANTMRQLTHSPHVGVNLSSLVRPELVRFKAEDGLELSGWLYRPRGPVKPGPIVLSFHGGPERQEQPYFSSAYQALLMRGMAVFAPNVRGSSGFGKKFVNLDNGPLRVNAIKDIKACVDYVVSTGIADPKRIGIMGGSYGGYMTMAGLTEYPDLFAAGANLFGVVNFETFFANTEPYIAAISTIEYGDPKTQVELLRSLSPIHKIDRVKAPTIVLHGANDTNVPVVEAEQVVNSLKKHGVPVEYILFPDEGHGFRKTPNRIRANVAMVEWFEKHLQAR
jgi:dipeptidyl aminopeptidase/acylaminoacyl peptidase